MSKLALYELVSQHRSLEALAESADLPAEVIRDTLDGLEGELRDKAVSVAHFCRNLESTADAIDEAAEQMRERGTRLRKRAQSLNEYLLFHLQAAGISKVESPYFSLKVKTNPPTVVIDSESLIPAEYMTQPEPLPPPPPRPDKKAIAAAFKAGEEVPGCHVEQRQRLEIEL
jgi:hypothetical protein